MVTGNFTVCKGVKGNKGVLVAQDVKSAVKSISGSVIEDIYNMILASLCPHKQCI